MAKKTKVFIYQRGNEAGIRVEFGADAIGLTGYAQSVKLTDDELIALATSMLNIAGQRRAAKSVARARRES